MSTLGIKRLFFGFSIIIVFLVLSLIRLYPLLTQEENTLSVLNGILMLNIKNTDLYEYDFDSSFTYYLTKTKNGFEPIILLVENDGWNFIDQAGSGFIFEKSTDDKEKLTVGTVQFSRYYRLWTLPKATN